MNILELACSIGWPVEFLAFERGLVVRPSGDTWVTHGGSRAGPVQISIDEVTARWRPVLVRCRRESGGSPLDVMLRPDGGIAPRIPHPATPPGLFYDSFALQYLADALLHHVSGLVSAYEHVRDTFQDISRIPGAGCEQRALFQGRAEPYYEFDALLSVARRGYDACRFLMWKCFGPGRGHMPRSFERVLPLCHRLPIETRENLQHSWDNWGLLVTKYRDCIHHYVPLDFGLASIDMQEDFAGVWIAWARIPDNPDARSKAGFKFSKGLDALTFGWQIAAEVSRILRVVSAAVEQRPKG